MAGTFITLPAREASRLGLDYHNGQTLVMETVNGNMFAYRLKLDTVRVGDMAVNNVDAVVTEGNSLPIALLGTSLPVLGRRPRSQADWSA